MEKIKIRLYRHKYFEDVYLARNYGYTGTITKELCFPVSEFEAVVLEESVNK